MYIIYSGHALCIIGLYCAVSGAPHSAVQPVDGNFEGGGLDKPGKLVPKATNVIEVTVSLRPTVQPKALALSPTRAVNKPMILIETTNAAQPPQ